MYHARPRQRAAAAAREADESQVATAGKLAPELVGIHCLAKRWAKDVEFNIKSRHALERIQLMHDGAVLGGYHENFPPDQWAFQEVFQTADFKTQAIINLYYRDDAPVRVKAERLQVPRTKFYEAWKMALAYMRGGVSAKGFPT